MVSRINAVQAAGHHMPPWGCTVDRLARQSRRSGADDESRRESNLSLGQHVASPCWIVVQDLKMGGQTAVAIKLRFWNSI
jgi:hypothetical protein